MLIKEGFNFAMPPISRQNHASSSNKPHESSTEIPITIGYLTTNTSKLDTIRRTNFIKKNISGT